MCKMLPRSRSNNGLHTEPRLRMAMDILELSPFENKALLCGFRFKYLILVSIQRNEEAKVIEVIFLFLDAGSSFKAHSSFRSLMLMRICRMQWFMVYYISFGLVFCYYLILSVRPFGRSICHIGLAYAYQYISLLVLNVQEIVCILKAFRQSKMGLGKSSDDDCIDLAKKKVCISFIMKLNVSFFSFYCIRPPEPSIICWKSTFFNPNLFCATCWSAC